MSGDVQPRKRKDKKRKKDELGFEEPRGTAAALGEGDVFMHSPHEHGTGGHWCAKIIFFSLLAVLITLIGLIILENRGLSELEANSVESRYSGVLEGWLEDAPDDDHHDAHTLELKHPDDDSSRDQYGSHDLEHDDEDEHDEGDHEDEDEDVHEDDDDGTQEDEDDETHEDDDDERDEVEQADEDEENEQDEEDEEYDRDDDEDVENYADEDDDDEGNRQDDDEDEENEQDEDEQEDNQDLDQDADDQDDDIDERYDTQEFEDDEDTREDGDDDEQEDEEEPANDEDEEEHHEDDEEADDEVEVEKIEREASEEEPISLELPALPEEDDDDDGKDDDKDDDVTDEAESPDDEEEAIDNDDDDDEEDEDDGEEDFLEADERVERITAPAGKPFIEVDDDDASSERPPDTLEEEEEYEKQQEELRRQEEQSSHMWLKLSVGGALLAATVSVLRRAVAPSDDDAEEEREAREETPADRRMTLIPEQSSLPVLKKKESERPVLEELVRKETPVLQIPSPVKQDDEEEEVEEPEELDEEIEEIDEPVEEPNKADKELYSDEEEIEEEEVIVAKKAAPKPSAPAPEPEADPDEVPDDVEIIDDEQLEEELEEEEDEEDISDVDDAELLNRLEAKYGRLPEPERPGQKHKDGGNSLDDEWPGEPSDAFWRQELDSAEREFRQGAWDSAASRVAVPQLAGSGRARYILATSLDRQAEANRDNALLSRAILAYLDLLKMNENLSNEKLLRVASRALDRIQFRGSYISAEPVYRLLIRRFPDRPEYRNNLTVSYLMANRADLAEQVLRETLQIWPSDRVALAHIGFVLKTQGNKLEEAVNAFEKALEGDTGPACEPRFYYHYGDALLLLGRYEEAQKVHGRGAKLGHFLSAAQRSLYNVPRLEGKPWWNVEDTPYVKLARALESSWREILKEGKAVETLYEQEKEGLKERGEWSQMDLFVRGREVSGRCARAPVTCGIVRAEPAAAGCRRGQVKFSAMRPATHVRPHVGPTNCRLRMHLGLSNTKDTYIRVDKEVRQWQEGKVLLFDDSFEHEVWHNGTGKRLVLIVDVWHPQLTAAEKSTLPAI